MKMSKLHTYLIKVCTFLLIFILAGGVDAKAASSYNFSGATTVKTDGTLVTGALSGSVQSKVFAFKTTANNSYYDISVINMSCQHQLEVNLYDANGAQICWLAYTDVNTKDITCKKLKSNTKYYVVVESFCGYTNNGNFKVGVQEVVDDAADDFAGASTVSMDNAFTGTIEVGGDVDFYKFTNTRSGKGYYNLDIMNTGDDYIHVYLYDENWTYLSEYSYISAHKRNVYEVKLTPNKTYYLKVKGYSNPSSYKITASFLKDEIGDDFSEAKSISLNQKMSNCLQSSEDDDYFKFKTNSKNTTYILDVVNKASSEWLYGAIYDSNYGQVTSFIVTAYNGKMNKTYTLDKNKTYYLVLYGDSYVEYEFTVKTPQETSYKITYKLNGGKNHADNPGSYTASQSVKLKKPTRKGYSFKGWYTDRSFKNRITTIKKGSTTKYTLYAKWEKVKVKQAGVKSAKNTGKGKAKVTINKVSGASGYEIVIASNAKMTKDKKTYTVSKTSKTISNLKKGKTYYVKVRAFKKDSTGAKVYGKYSTAKKVRIKK